MLHAVIMAGGSGTRFWPQSRRALPKQFLKLAGARTMIQATVDRCRDWLPVDNITVVAGDSLVPTAITQLPELPERNFFAEPCARNTAPCIALAALQLVARDPDATMVVLPADHVIEPQAAFRQAVAQAAEIVTNDPQQLVLFGVRPTFPATGYGYIEQGPEGLLGSRAVASFREKPDLPVAEEYLRRGTFLWNCGIFVWRAQRILDAIAEYQPGMRAGLDVLRRACGTADWQTAVATEFPRWPSISIDYAVLEHRPAISVLEAPFAWDDVGSWRAVQRLLGTDADANTIDGQQLGVETSGCIVRSSPDHLVATLGVRDLIIVHTPDATLVANKQDEESVRRLVDLLKARGLDQYL
ncbi:MAG: mannose-1-phosphate guanylyltransferase [Planctomycetota bacterium]